MKTRITLTVNVGHKPSASARKSLVRNLRALENHLKGEPLKLAYCAPNGTRPYVYEYTINSSVNNFTEWRWDTTLSYEIERGNITTIPEQFIEQVAKTLEARKAKQDSEKITNAKRVLAGLSEAERKLVLDSVSKPKAPRKVRDPAQKLLNTMIDGKQPPLPKDGKPRVVKSRESKRKTAEEKAA